ncbi:hypothetical protein ACS0TY_013577 [Phlomoides rotata]
MARFLIVDVPSSYNVIFGRHILNLFQAIVSTFRMKMKFPAQENVGELRKDQYQARRCYVESVVRIFLS